MSNDLTQTSQGGAIAEAGSSLLPAGFLQKSKFGDDGTHDKVGGSGKFLPRVQLMAGLSRLVTKGKAKLGTYVLVKGKENIMADFGEAFNCVPLTWRPRAMNMTGEKPVSFYNPSSAKFQDVERKAETKPQAIKGYIYGPEYLIYIPDVGELAVFFFNNKSMRMRSGEMKALIGQAATLRVEMVEDKGNIWPVPVITGCSTPFAELPLDRINSSMEMFNNPPDEEEVIEQDGVETVAGGNDQDRLR